MTLLSRDAFCVRVGITGQCLDALVAKGSLFALEEDGHERYPLILADPSLGRRRLHLLCRILVPSPAAARLVFLVSGLASLGGLSPLEMLRERSRFRLLREAAAAWAAEWTRTAVKIFAGHHSAPPARLPTVYVAIDEVDPRRDVWKRVEGAMQAGGYIEPDGPYPFLTNATVFVARQPAGSPDSTIDARMEVTVDGFTSRTLIELPGQRSYVRFVQLDREGLDITEVVSAIVSTLRKRRT